MIEQQTEGRSTPHPQAPLEVDSNTSTAPDQNSSDLTWPLPSLEVPNFVWGNVPGEELCALMNQAYEEVVHWRRNLFQIPSGSTGKAFVTELARLYQVYADGSSLESMSMKACTVAPILLLQKPSRTSKSKDHVNHLQRRLDLWHKQS